jgi:carboxylesterase
MRPLAQGLANAGYAVELPLLPGHGTSVEDLIPTRWSDWLGTAEAAYAELAARGLPVVVAGLSMGGSLTLALGEAHPEIAGLVVVNPLVLDLDPALKEAGQQMIDAGVETIPSIGGDIKRQGIDELSYDATPLAPAQSLFEGLTSVRETLSTVAMPVLLCSSREDHTVAPENGDYVAHALRGPVERVMLEDSYHVATIDNDADRITSHALAFCARVFHR